MTRDYVPLRITSVGQSMIPNDDGQTVRHTLSMKGVGAGPTMGLIAALRIHAPEHAQLTLKGAGSTGDGSQDTWEVLLEWESPLASPAPIPYATGALPHAGHKPGCRCMKPRSAGDAFVRHMEELQAQKYPGALADSAAYANGGVIRRAGDTFGQGDLRARGQAAVDAQNEEIRQGLLADHERITRDYAARQKPADGPMDGSKAAEMDYSRTLSERNRHEREQEYRLAFEEEQGG